MIIELSQEEIVKAATVGISRDVESVLNNRVAIFRDSEQNIAFNHIIGALGELAACKALGVEWERTINTFKKKADIVYKGISLEVKTSRYPRIQVRHNDRKLIKDTKIVSVQYLGKYFKFDVRGWETLDTCIRLGRKLPNEQTWWYEGKLKPLADL